MGEGGGSTILLNSIELFLLTDEVLATSGFSHNLGAKKTDWTFQTVPGEKTFIFLNRT